MNDGQWKALDSFIEPEDFTPTRLRFLVPSETKNRRDRRKDKSLNRKRKHNDSDHPAAGEDLP